MYEDRGGYRYQKIVHLPDGSSRRVSVRARTQQECQRKMRQREAELERTHPDALHMTLEQYLARWLRHKDATVKARTASEYRTVIERHVTPAIGHLPLARLRPMHVQEMMQAVLAKREEDDLEGMRATANNARRYLLQAMRQAERWELITSNPARNIQPVSKAATKRGAWGAEDIQRFFEAARGRPYHALFYVALMTGMRKGELIALEWRHVGEAGIQVRQTHSRHEADGVTTPKTTASARDIPISPDVRAVLADQYDRTGGGRWVFTTANGRMLSPSNVTRSFRVRCRAAGVPLIRFHDLRRTAATHWARKGFTPKLIQALLGHSTHHVAMSVYTDVLNEQWADAYLTLDDVTGGCTNGRNATQRQPDEPGRETDAKAEEEPTRTPPN